MRKKIKNRYFQPFGMCIGFLVGVIVGYFFLSIELSIFLGLAVASVAGLAIRRRHY